MRVEVRGDNMSAVNQAYRKLQNMLEREGTIKEIRQHERYEKPSEKRRRKMLRKKQTITKVREEKRS